MVQVKINIIIMTIYNNHTESHKKHHTPSNKLVYICNLNNNIIILGPGGQKMAHQTDEWIDINDVVKAAEIYIELAEWF